MLRRHAPYCMAFAFGAAQRTTCPVASARSGGLQINRLRLPGAAEDDCWIKETDMTWAWRCEDAEGTAMSGPEETFTSQSDAESWLGQHWRDLIAAGAATATLVDDDRVEYRMSLAPAGQ